MHCRKSGRLRPYLDPHQRGVLVDRRKDPDLRPALRSKRAVMELSVSDQCSTLDFTHCTIDIVPLYIEYQYVMILDS
ncbi:hypothetical protein DPMN_125304 [Dreissena polymorpha]|uniref:Uncharacterized protein n=1 Tax=Dreissena polymorpha TaxID=45954 RepID=A0A9D4GY02_DREPO|nr:hypothetical protein DPMN_125304 [Dreissena polymorpha]